MRCSVSWHSSRHQRVPAIFGARNLFGTCAQPTESMHQAGSTLRFLLNAESFPLLVRFQLRGGLKSALPEMQRIHIQPRRLFSSAWCRPTSEPGFSRPLRPALALRAVRVPGQRVKNSLCLTHSLSLTPRPSPIGWQRVADGQVRAWEWLRPRDGSRRNRSANSPASQQVARPRARRFSRPPRPGHALRSAAL